MLFIRGILILNEYSFGHCVIIYEISHPPKLSTKRFEMKNTKNKNKTEAHIKCP